MIIMILLTMIIRPGPRGASRPRAYQGGPLRRGLGLGWRELDLLSSLSLSTYSSRIIITITITITITTTTTTTTIIIIIIIINIIIMFVISH